MLKIEIEYTGESAPERWAGFRVIQGDKYADALGFDEMLAVIVTLTIPEKTPHLAWMKTKEQHEKEERVMKEIGKKNSSVPLYDGNISF